MTTATKSNEAQLLADLPALDDQPQYAAAWQRLQELTELESTISDRLAELSNNGGAHLEAEAEAMRAGRKLRKAEQQESINDLQHRKRVLVRAIEQQEKAVRQAEHDCCRSIAHEVQQAELEHARRIAKYMQQLRSALLDRQQLHESLRDKGYGDELFTKIAWVRFRYISDDPISPDIFQLWLQQAAEEYQL